MVVVFYNSVSLQESFKLLVHVVEISWTWISFVNLLHHAQVNYNRSQYSKIEQKSKDSCLLLFCGTPTEHLHRNGMLQVAVTCTVHGCCLGAKSCPTLCNPSTVARQASLSMGFFQARTLEWVAISSFLTQGLNPCLLQWQADFLPPSHKGSPCILNIPLAPFFTHLRKY